jgi:hypothetical protein
MDLLAGWAATKHGIFETRRTRFVTQSGMSFYITRGAVNGAVVFGTARE